ncbi:MAG: PPE domain-containing protein [Actinomycetota bacterium]|nr:PPE domain-containing protein [Actinomycetota bacterium]
MPGDEVKVDPDDLRAKAGQIDAISWGANPAEAPAAPADALPTAQTAVDNLNQNARTLAEYQDHGRQQGQRLAESLRNVADAYAAVDANAMTNINNTIPGEAPAPPEPVTPRGNTVPEPAAPSPNPAPAGMPTEGYMEVKMAQGSLLNGDQAASLQAAAATWSQNSSRLATTAEEFEIADVNWEGEAADAAYRMFADYRGFLLELSGAWSRLAAEAQAVADAHFSALDQHTPIAERYAELEAELPAAIANGGAAARTIQLEMEKLQHESEEVRQKYSRDAQPDEVTPPEPCRNTGTPPHPVRDNGDPRQPARPLHGQGDSTGGGAQPGSGAGPAEAAPQEAPVSPMSATEQAGQPAPQGAPQGQGGGPPAGGQGGSQGGSPGGGTPGGAPSGMPGLGKGDPKLPTDPSVRPAAAGGGGAGAGGGGGGGMPSSPLQPAVGAETVAPTPVASPGAPGAAAGGGAGGGAAGGGMGGMAPMMGGARGGGESGDKKRNPQLSEDEEIYTEDRPYTEPVIGYRPRRRGGSDDSKKESQ